MLGSQKATGCVLASPFYRGEAALSTTTVRDSSRWGNDGTGANLATVRLPSGLWVYSFNGSSSVIDIGDTDRNVQTFVAWVYPDDNTSRSIADFDAGTHSVELDASGDLTATAWGAPTTYVNGAASAAVAQSVWNLVMVTTATAFAASDLDIGKEVNFFDGYIALVRAYDYALSSVQARGIYTKEYQLFL